MNKPLKATTKSDLALDLDDKLDLETEMASLLGLDLPMVEMN
jgi:hypothetical protein